MTTDTLSNESIETARFEIVHFHDFDENMEAKETILAALALAERVNKAEVFTVFNNAGKYEYICVADIEGEK